MSLTILAKKDLIDSRYLKECDTEEAREVMKQNAEQRSYNRINRSGFSPNHNMREVSGIPTNIYWHPKLRHIFHNVDAREGAILRKRFLREFTKFLTVDKL